MAKWRELSRRRLPGVVIHRNGLGVVVPLVTVHEEVREIQGPARAPTATRQHVDSTYLFALDDGAPSEVLLALEVTEVALPKIEAWAARAMEARS